ncbi:MAG: UPF0147 family protein [Candidatus Woesearchaeota archaeon]
MDAKAIIEFVELIETDYSTPKNVKDKLAEIKKILNEKGKDKAIKADKCISILEELDEDPNIEPFTRTNLWNLVSMLEQFKE